MTKEEILKQIEELKKQVEELSDEVENKVRTSPTKNENYIYVNTRDLCCYKYNYLPAESSSIGNYFKSEKDAQMVIKAMQIEQSIRVRRIELNNGWEPDWDNENEYKYSICFTGEGGGYLTVYKTLLNKIVSIFGYYKTEKIALQIINLFEHDLLWYFNEYYPNRDNIYIWSEGE